MENTRKSKNTLIISLGVLLFFCVLMAHFKNMKSVFSTEVAKPKLLEKYGEWSYLREIPISENILEVLGTKGAVLGEYKNAQGEKLQVYILKASLKRSSIHQPEYCYLGATEELIKKGSLNIDLNKKEKIPVNYLLVKTQAGIDLVMYTYETNCIFTNNYYWQQFLFLIQRLKGHSVNGSLIRVSKSTINDKLSDDIKVLQLVIKSIVISDNSSINKNF
ncbi:MAG: exosortase C-terminal domain/associated protein EpsI [Candidatus Omnitrophota bacterium]